MKIKDIMHNLFPSYRVGKMMINELSEKSNYLECKMRLLEQRLVNCDGKNEYMFWLSQMRDGEALEETKKRVFLDMPKASGHLRDIQIAENYILNRLKDICDKNGLKIYLAGGTMLGAVRHHGFIPWDDDIDTYMFSDDANKLIKLLADDSELTAWYYYTTNGLVLIKVKFTFSDSVFVDIFRLDYMECKDDADAAVRFKETQKVAAKFSAKVKELLPNDESVHNYRIPLRFEEIDDRVEEIYRQLIRELPYYGHGNYVCQSIHDGYKFRVPTGIFSVEDTFPLLEDEVVFENRKYSVFRNYMKRLNYHYGDIMTFPNGVAPSHYSDEFKDLDKILGYIKGKEE